MTAGFTGTESPAGTPSDPPAQPVQADALRGAPAETPEPERLGRRIMHLVPILAAGACALAVGIAIFMLTEQTPDETTAASGAVNDFLIGLFGEIPGVYDPEGGLWLGIDVRHWAHTAEFWMLGVLVAITALLAMGTQHRARPAATALAICAACSLADQCHKLFVPGRHFDWFDLAMDALGYCTAIIAVLAIATLWRRFAQRRRDRPRPHWA